MGVYEENAQRSRSNPGNFFTNWQSYEKHGPCNLRCHSKDVIKGSFVALRLFSLCSTAAIAMVMLVVNTGSFLLQVPSLENKWGYSNSIGGRETR